MKAAPPAILALEDGGLFRGFALGANVESAGEVVFQTSFCGYQESLTDPSYKGQILCMAFPQIGNYGFCEEAKESEGLHLAGFAVAEASGAAGDSLDAYLARNGVAGITGIDTRALIRRIRAGGAMRGVISHGAGAPEKLVARARTLPSMQGSDLVTAARATPPAIANPQGRIPIALLDCGAKAGIRDSLARRDCRVLAFPASATAREILAARPAGLVLSNGPGDPAALSGIVAEVRTLLGKLPIMGICLGHQLLALAAGGRTYKLPFGHRGSNHPVIDLATGRIAITSQNHGFAVEEASLPSGVRPTERNLYDGTNEGIEIPAARAFSVQYHPEARPGPRDARERFDRFLEIVKAHA